LFAPQSSIAGFKRLAKQSMRLGYRRIVMVTATRPATEIIFRLSEYVRSGAEVILLVTASGQPEIARGVKISYDEPPRVEWPCARMFTQVVTRFLGFRGAVIPGWMYRSSRIAWKRRLAFFRPDIVVIEPALQWVGRPPDASLILAPWDDLPSEL